jgi:hypothetical protein
MVKIRDSILSVAMAGVFGMGYHIGASLKDLNYFHFGNN